MPPARRIDRAWPGDHAHPLRPSRVPARLAIAGEEMTLAELCVAIACGTAGVVFLWIVTVFFVAAFGP